MKCTRCQQDNPTEQKFCGECGTPLGAVRPTGPPAPSYAEVTSALSGALEQQTATSEILRVIASSPTDVQPVLDVMAESAARLCEAADASIFRVEGDRLGLVAQHGAMPHGPVGEWSLPLVRQAVTGRSVIDARTVHLADVLAEAEEFPVTIPNARRVGFRTMLTVPLVRDGVGIGAITVFRREPRLFSGRQVALLQTFADQAVIAIENVRLFNETKDALERQTATSEILSVISRSPTDVQPVLEAICQSAVRLFNAYAGAIVRFDGQLMHLGAVVSPSAEADEQYRRLFPRPPDPQLATGQAILGRTIVQISDIEHQDTSERNRTLGRDFGYRRLLVMPMVRDGLAIGALAVTGREPGCYSDRQIALLQTFADQAVIAIENVRLFTELQASNQDLTTALNKQIATSDILRVISQSQTDVKPVFEAILSSAIRLIRAYAGAMTLVAGDELELAAFKSSDSDGETTLRSTFPLSLRSQGSHANAIRDRKAVNHRQAQTDPDIGNAGHSIAQAVGYQSMVVVPLLHHDVAVGTISAARREPGGFADDEIDLLRTFADQAVIAIENVRLFTELQEKNRALTEAHAQVTEALDHQTATSEVLKVISSSPTDVQPVFDAIAESAARLCDGVFGIVYRLDGEMVHMVAHHNVSPEGWAAYQALYPRPLNRQTNSGRAMLDGRVAITEDIEADTERSTATREAPRRVGLRSAVTVPLLHNERTIGALTVGRAEPGAFSPKQVTLLETFADQAVIAIENVRLFTELQASNRELTTALDKQTATSDILRVISQSQTDVQPVFDAILASAVRLLGAYAGALSRIVGDQIELAALMGHNDAGDAAVRSNFPYSLESEGSHARAIRDRAPLNIADVPAQAAAGVRDRTAWPSDIRSLVVVPMLLHDEAVGAIGVTRREPGGFTDDEIALLQTFADQAVIAIENVRLFRELEARTQDLTRSVGQLTALGEVGRAVSSTLDLETVLSTIVSRAIQLSGTDGGSVYEYDEATEEFSLRASRDLPEAYVEQVRDTRPRKGEGAVGRVAQTREPVQIVDISDATAYESRVRDMLLKIGLRALLAVPLIAEDQLVGALIVMRKRTGTFAAEEVTLLQTFATQSALAIQNARLFREIEDKGRQLEAASQHKSEFLANMSHELRTPLNAIIGFSEVLGERMFGELNEKQEEYLKDIHASGQHLLSLINDILDLSKIEAGRMELELTDFNLPATLDNALTLVRERAGRRGIALGLTVDERLEQIRADERKVRQVVLNLLSNAIKFTPGGGRIEVRAVPVDGVVEISVTDTGVGIAPEDQEAIFEEFRQVGMADKKVEGTGLGLTLCRKFVELHGGKIWVNSQVGAGSTFTFTIPMPVRNEANAE